MGDFDATALAKTAWAFAKAGQFDTPLFLALVRVTKYRVLDFTQVDLACSAWAYAKAAQFDAALSEMLVDKGLPGPTSASLELPWLP